MGNTLLKLRGAGIVLGLLLTPGLSLATNGYFAHAIARNNAAWPEPAPRSGQTHL